MSDCGPDAPECEKDHHRCGLSATGANIEISLISSADPFAASVAGKASLSDGPSRLLLVVVATLYDLHCVIVCAVDQSVFAVNASRRPPS